MRVGVIEEDRGLAQHIMALERRQGEQSAVDVELEIGSDHGGERQRPLQSSPLQVILEEARRGHGPCGQDHD